MNQKFFEIGRVFKKYNANSQFQKDFVCQTQTLEIEVRN